MFPFNNSEFRLLFSKVLETDRGDFVSVLEMYCSFVIILPLWTVNFSIIVSVPIPTFPEMLEEPATSSSVFGFVLFIPTFPLSTRNTILCSLLYISAIV